jgi:uncharacterized protein (DUF58 family)
VTPTPRLVSLLALLLGLGVLTAVGWLPTHLWQTLLAVSLSTAAVDFALALREPALTSRRDLSQSLPLGVYTRASFRVSNAGRRRLAVDAYDHFPQAFEATGLPQSFTVQPGGWTKIHYRLRPEERGEHRFGRIQLQVRSPLGLWRRNEFAGEVATVRVYPNFAAVTKYALLATEERLNQIGILKQRRRGQGSEFHQLREYRQGDALRQVDWRASARVHKLISREYQDERDQRVVFLLDCGRRMRARDAELSHFDQALNAVLLLAYVALRKGDSVGVATFGGEDRWQAPAKGQITLNRILNLLYDLQPQTVVPDYRRAAVELVARQRKRALVIVVTNLRDEDSEDLQAAANLLKRRHLVLVASLREAAVDDVLEGDVADFGDALRVAAAHDYLRHREKGLELLRAMGIASVDVQPQALSLELVNTYLAIKAQGAL